MRKIIIVLFCLISLVTKAQVYQEMPQYGYRANRMSFDSTLQIPTTCGVPTLKSVVNVSKKAAIAFDSCNNKFYKYNPKTLIWSEISGGGTTPNLQQVLTQGRTENNGFWDITLNEFYNSANDNYIFKSYNYDKPEIVGELSVGTNTNTYFRFGDYTLGYGTGFVELNPFELKFGNPYSSFLNKIIIPENNTAEYKDTLPKANGVFALSVNGIKANDTGNVVINIPSQIDTMSLSNRINTKIDSLKRQTDSVFARKNGSWIFQYNGFVPYTGATGDVDLGNNQLNAKAIKINGTAGNGHIDLKHQSADASATGSSTALFANSNGDLKWKNDNKYYTTLATNQSADRVYTFQNKSYTLADSADVAARVKYTDTSSMLTNYAKTNLVNTKVNITDTASMLSNYQRSNTAVKYSDTTSIIATKTNLLSEINYSDTTSIIATKTNLASKLNISDSTIYYSKYRSDTSRSNIYSAINGKQATITFTTNNTSGVATFTSNTLNIPNYSNNDALVAQAYGLLGSTIKGINLGLPNYAMMTGTANALVSGTVRFIAYYLPNAQTITGVKWWSSANASYTANNYNGVGLYSYSGGTLTLVASSTNDANIWSGAASNSMGSKAFSQQIALSAGIYYIGLLYNASSGTGPSLGSGGTTTQTNMGSADFTNSAKISSSLLSQTALPNSQAMSGTTVGTVSLGAWLY